jgi:hypothetical protein
MRWQAALSHLTRVLAAQLTPRGARVKNNDNNDNNSLNHNHNHNSNHNKHAYAE